MKSLVIVLMLGVFYASFCAPIAYLQDKINDGRTERPLGEFRPPMKYLYTGDTLYFPFMIKRVGGSVDTVVIMKYIKTIPSDSGMATIIRNLGFIGGDVQCDTCTTR
jgi:hypothetical protein